MDALRPLWDAERPGYIPTRSVGTIKQEVHAHKKTASLRFFCACKLPLKRTATAAG